MSDTAIKAPRERLSESSKVLRIGGATYTRLLKLKARYAKRRGGKVTYDRMLIEALNVAEMLMDGRELYDVNGKLFDDLAIARGEAIHISVKQKADPEWPTILVELGKDTGP